MSSSFFQPVDAAAVPRFAGHSTFMRLPAVASAAGLDIALVGIPWDGGTTNRAGARHGPREIRNQSSLMRRVHHVSKTEPFSIANIADVGDVSVNPIDLLDGLKRIEDGIAAIVAAGAIPLAAGGDHLTTLPVLRAVGRGCAGRPGTLRRPFGHQRHLLRGQSLHSRHAFPPRHRRGPARPRAHRPDRHTRLHLRAARA